MSQTFKCPNCGASLRYDGGPDLTIECPYYAIGIFPLRLHPIYHAAMEIVKNDPAVIELFGSPVQDSLFVLGTISNGSANLQVEIRGPRARGTAHIWGRKDEDGTVHVFSIRIKIGGEEILEYRDSEPEKGFQSPRAAARTHLSPTLIPSPTPSPTPPGYASAVLQFDGKGTGPGWFQDARSIALDGAGHIYVAEYTGGRVQAFDSSGKFITQWSVGGSKTHIYSMMADRRGTVYVVANGRILRVEGATGKSLGKLEYPEGDRFHTVTLTPDGGLVALDWDDNLVRFDANGQVTQVLHDVIGSLTDGSEHTDYVAADGLGNIFIASSIPGLIFKFTPEGRFVDRFGGRGDAPGQFSTPIDAIAVDHQGRVYAADFDGIKVFDATGSCLGLFKVKGAVRAMTFNDQNDLFVVTGAQQVTKFRLNRP